MRGLGAAVLVLVCAASCQQATIGDVVDTADARPPLRTDAATTDASSSGDIDAAVTPDAAEPDAAPDASLPPPPPCDELYGAAPEYILCAEDETTCTFNARTDGGTCNEMCALFGGTCLEAHDNESTPGTECNAILLTGDDCNTSRSTEICVCTRS